MRFLDQLLGLSLEREMRADGQHQLADIVRTMRWARLVALFALIVALANVGIIWARVFSCS